MASLERLLPGRQPVAVEPTPLPDLVQVVLDGEVIYISRDGRYALGGPLVEIANRLNLTETRLKENRRAVLAELRDEQTVVFPPQGESKGMVTVFTDIDCPYCRRFHQEYLPEYQAAGIGVRYLLLPRGGEGTAPYTQALAVVCAESPEAQRQALTRAKAGQTLEPKRCDNSPLALHRSLADRLHIQGTPTLILPNGRQVAGLLHADQIQKLLQE